MLANKMYDALYCFNADKWQIQIYRIFLLWHAIIDLFNFPSFQEKRQLFIDCLRMHRFIVKHNWYVTKSCMHSKSYSKNMIDIKDSKKDHKFSFNSNYRYREKELYSA